MRGKKTSAEIKAMVIALKVKNPSMSSRDIATEISRELWDVSNDTVCDILNEDLPQVATESQAIANLLDTNNELQSLADLAIKKKILAWEESIRISELVSLRESTFRQSQLIQGKSTDNSEVKIKWEV
jgi:hypothetical protein